MKRYVIRSTLQKKGLLLLTGIIFSASALAISPPQLLLQMKSGIAASVLRDGQRLGEGVIVNHEAHIGFLLHCNNGTTASHLDCVLRGKNNGRHQISVRLEPRQMQVTVSALDDGGMMLSTVSDEARFNIVVAGNQAVSPDIYTLQASGSAIPVGKLNYK